MFRRNRPLRARRLFGGGLFSPNGALAADARQAFDQANAQYAAGQYAEAAAQYSHLAEVALTLGRPRRVIQLHLRAFDAWLAAKNGDEALHDARSALALANRRPRKAARLAEALITDLRTRGFPNQANALAGVSGIPAAEMAQAQKEVATQKPLVFPTVCPQCGGRLPKAYGEDEIECDYCGTVVRGQ